MTAVHTTYVDQLFQQGKEAIEAGAFEKAKDSYEEVIKLRHRCMEAWNNLGVALCELHQFRRSLEAYGKINEDVRTTIAFLPDS